MKVGDIVKVILDGERPFVEVLSVNKIGFKGRIINKLFNEYSEIERRSFLRDTFDCKTSDLKSPHSYKKGDIVSFISINGTHYAKHSNALASITTDCIIILFDGSKK